MWAELSFVTSLSYLTWLMKTVNCSPEESLKQIQREKLQLYMGYVECHNLSIIYLCKLKQIMDFSLGMVGRTAQIVNYEEMSNVVSLPSARKAQCL